MNPEDIFSTVSERAKESTLAILWGDTSDEEPVLRGVGSAFVVEVDGFWLLFTALHVAIEFNATRVRNSDSFLYLTHYKIGDHGEYKEIAKHGIAFRFAEEFFAEIDKETILHVGDSDRIDWKDIVAVPLHEIYIENLKKTGFRPFSYDDVVRTTVDCPCLETIDIFASGFPSNLISPYLDRYKYGLIVAPGVIEDSDRTRMITMPLQHEGKSVEIDCKGMSGGPVMWFSQERVRLIGLTIGQSTNGKRTQLLINDSLTIDHVIQKYKLRLGNS